MNTTPVTTAPLNKDTTDVTSDDPIATFEAEVEAFFEKMRAEREADRQDWLDELDAIKNKIDDWEAHISTWEAILDALRPR